MDTHFLYREPKLSLDAAIETGNIFGIRNSDEPAQHSHLVAALQRPHSHSHLLEAVVGKLLGQDNGLRTIEEAAAFARNIGRTEIARRLDRAVEVNRQEAPHPKQKNGRPQFTAAAVA